MAAALGINSIAEPSVPEERATSGLPPKSYAEATAADADAALGGTSSSRNGETQSNASTLANGSGPRIERENSPEGNNFHGDGEHLSTLRRSKTYAEALDHSTQSTSRDRQKSRKQHDGDDVKLASGRRAGAGWGRSA